MCASIYMYVVSLAEGVIYGIHKEGGVCVCAWERYVNIIAREKTIKTMNG